MLKDLEKAVQDDLDKDFPEASKLKANFTVKPPILSVADQLLAIAKTLESIDQDIDVMQQEFINRCMAIRQRLRSRG
jgi:hypothetical protein